MSIKVALEHRTTYRFDRPIDIGPHVIRLRPAPHTRTPIEAYSLRISPENHFLNWQQDPFGNYLARVVFPEKADELDITVGLVADLEVVNPFDFFIEEYAETFPFTYPDALRADLEPYLVPVEDAPGLGLGPVLSGWLEGLPLGKPGLDGAGQPTVDFLVALNAAVALGTLEISVVGTALAFTLYLQGVSDVGGVRASLLACTEPVSAALCAALWLHTSFAWQDLLGFAAILVMAVLIALPERASEKSTEKAEN